MSLSSIRAFVIAERGINANDTTYLDSIINQAAKEIFTSYDLPNSLDEILVTLNEGADQQRVSLPWNVANIRAIKDDAQDFKWDLLDIRHAYQDGGWRPPYYGFRTIKSNAALCRELVDTVPLTFTLSAAEGSDVVIDVIGKISTGERIKDTITITAGNLTADSARAFFDVHQIVKRSTTQSDITVTDLAGNIVAYIPNYREYSRYYIVNIQDRSRSYDTNKKVRILYKPHYTPMVHDSEVFICGEEYEDIIYWETISRLWSTEDADGSADKALLAKQRSMGLLEAAMRNEDRTKDVRVNMGQNRYIRTLQHIKHARFYKESI